MLPFSFSLRNRKACRTAGTAAGGQMRQRQHTASKWMGGWLIAAIPITVIDAALLMLVSAAWIT